MLALKPLKFAPPFAALLFGACAPVPPPLEPAQLAPLQTGYPLAPDDRVRVTVFGEPTLTGEYGITSQGSVDFPLIGLVAADGKTTEQLARDIAARLEDGYINDPRVNVEILKYRPFYILGEVNKPGEYPFTNGLTVEQAVALAGGYTYRANRGKIFLRRRDRPERTVILARTLLQVLPGDTIRVGERYF